MNYVSSTDFDGETYVAQRDGVRLGRQLQRVYDVLKDGKYHSLSNIASQLEASEASVSARIRDLRKAKFGGYTVERRNAGGGTHFYRLDYPAPCERK